MGEKTVWLLGSGFSKPLGGPLLRDLFRQEREEDILPFYPANDFPNLAKSIPWVQLCFQNGTKEGLWENAEQFLAYVDDGYRANVAAKRARVVSLIGRYDPVSPELQMLWANSQDGRLVKHRNYHAAMPSSFDRTAKRALAAECSRFLLDASPATAEPWLPYRDWIESLRPGVDTVISFNYDRVIETAAAGASQLGKFWFAMPDQAPPANRVAVLKLHGSVDWKLVEDPADRSRQKMDSTADETILRSEDGNIAMAGPGGSKSQFVETHFRSLWKHAEEALTEAVRFMIVGYSFPDTDPTAQYRLLDAFASGTSRPTGRWVHIVLGPDVMMPIPQRIVSLIRSTGGSQVSLLNSASTDERRPYHLHITAERLYSQDFIGRYRRFTTTRADLEHEASLAARR